MKGAIRGKYEKELKLKVCRSSKLKEGPLKDESFEPQPYISRLKLSEARMNFRIRSNTTNVKMNQKNNREFAEKLWKCDGCGNLDTQCHLMWCPAYAPLREGLDIDSDVDVVKYFQEVFKLRETLPL